MAELLLGSQVWKTIRATSRRQGHRQVAVAYLGQGAPNQLPLRKGDTLVVDLSPEAVKAGSTSVVAARSYYRRNVKLYSLPKLHSKVFVLGDVAILGSANVSNASEKSLEEAGILIDDRRLVAKLRAYVESLAQQPVTPSYLRQCDVWSKETATARARLQRLIKKNGAAVSRPRLWLCESEPYDGKTDEKQDRAATARIKSPREFIAEPLFWSHPPQLHKMDSVIVAHKEPGKLLVLPPSKFLYQGTSPTGESVVYIEQPRRPILAQRDPFLNLVKRTYQQRFGTVPTKRVPNRSAPEFFRLWPKGVSRQRA